MKLRRFRIIRSSAIAAAFAVLAITAPLGEIAGRARAAPAFRSGDSQPVALAAGFIDIPTATLAADIVNETMRTGTIGVQVAVDQLDAALAMKLSALPSATDGGLILTHHSMIATHHAIRDALLDHTVTVLLNGGGG